MLLSSQRYVTPLACGGYSPGEFMEVALSSSGAVSVGHESTFVPRCPKCLSKSIHMLREPHPIRWGEKEIQMSCYTCGTVKYGEAAIREALDPQYEAWLLDRDRILRAQREARVLRERASALRSDLVPESICAWRTCDSPSRSGSKYCSRNCSNKNARARYRARNR